MKNLSLTILILALVAMLAGGALAQSGRGPRAPQADREDVEPGQMRLARMAARLNLTADQQQAIGDLQQKARRENLETRKQIERARHELRGEMLKDKPAERTVVQLTEKLGELQTTLKVSRAKLQLAIRDQLTPEQRDQMILQQGARRGGGNRGGDAGPGIRHGRGGRGGPGCCLHGPECPEGQRPGRRSGR